MRSRVSLPLRFAAFGMPSARISMPSAVPRVQLTRSPAARDQTWPTRAAFIARLQRVTCERALDRKSARKDARRVGIFRANASPPAPRTTETPQCQIQLRQIPRTACLSSTGSLFLTDGGLETTLIFHEGWEPADASQAFVLMESEKGRSALRDYYDRYIAIANERGTGFVLESPTWRANPDWARQGRLRPRSPGRRQSRRDRSHERDCATARDGGTPIVISGCSARAATATIPARS